MKILCVSDQIDPLIYTGSIKQRYADVDLILSAGDLPLDYIDFIVSTLNKPLLLVPGNHHADTGECEAFSIDCKVRYEGGLIVAGLGGCKRYNSGGNQYTDFQMNMRILKLLPALVFNRIFRGRYLDILLTHASPLGIHDRPDKCHQGFKGFLWFMRKFKPRYLIHGHIHLYDLSEKRASKFFNTDVINAYGHYMLVLDKKA